jgi:hypothetical protein
VPGNLTDLGTMSVGSANPMLGLAGAQLNVAATLAIGEVQAKLTGLLSLVAALTVPQIPALAIAGAAQALLSLEATVSAPDPTLQLQAVLAAAAELEASLLDLQAQLAFAVTIGEVTAAAGVTMYRYSGTADSFGPEVSAQTSGGIGGGAAGDHVEAFILAASAPAAVVALGQVFGL